MYTDKHFIWFLMGAVVQGLHTTDIQHYNAGVGFQVVYWHGDGIDTGDCKGGQFGDGLNECDGNGYPNYRR